MPFDLHTIETVDGASQTARTDRVILAFLPSVSSAAGAGAGDAVTVTISGLSLPSTPYVVHALPSQPAVVSVSAKTVGGFVLTLTPLTTGTTLAAGTVDVLAVA
jgi:hypothetical protein